MIKKIIVAALLVGSLTACEKSEFTKKCEARGGHVETHRETVYTKNGGTYRQTTKYCMYGKRVLDRERD